MRMQAIWGSGHVGRLSARFVHIFLGWERSSQLSLLTALVLLLITLLIAAFGPSNLRQLARIGAVGLIIVIQVIIMWANRGMVTPYTQAQRAYLAENFESTRDLLEAVRVAGKADARDLTLLGNTYRQLGQLEQSEAVLRQALELRPNLHFSLYGFGRTLLVQGRYTEAMDVLRHALEAGAPSLAGLDLADAYFRQGLWEDARATLPGIQVEEPYRLLMSQYLRYRLEIGGPPTLELMQSGLSYWRAHAERFRQTPYGQALADDIRHMQTLMKEV
jgi:tetratricopeptide (TPR) repeat protein